MSPYKTQNYYVQQTSAHPIRFHYSLFSRYDIIILPSPVKNEVCKAHFFFYSARFRVDGGVGGGGEGGLE